MFNSSRLGGIRYGDLKRESSDKPGALTVAAENRRRKMAEKELDVKFKLLAISQETQKKPRILRLDLVLPSHSRKLRGLGNW